MIVVVQSPWMTEMIVIEIMGVMTEMVGMVEEEGTIGRERVEGMVEDRQGRLVESMGGGMLILCAGIDNSLASSACSSSRAMYGRYTSEKHDARARDLDSQACFLLPTSSCVCSGTQ